jgi:hypothetical protein
MGKFKQEQRRTKCPSMISCGYAGWFVGRPKRAAVACVIPGPDETGSDNDMFIVVSDEDSDSDNEDGGHRWGKL